MPRTRWKRRSIRCGRRTTTRWANAKTGRRGSFAAAGDAFVRDDEVCRYFKTTMILDSGQQDLAGPRLPGGQRGTGSCARSALRRPETSAQHRCAVATATPHDVGKTRPAGSCP